MGFRDMHLFNQALLARQGWRLTQNPDSLCARVLKSKYYPHGNLLDTVFPADASQAWRGIEWGLELLKKGIIWRVGDGRKIQIQRDQWIDHFILVTACHHFIDEMIIFFCHV